MRLIRILMAVLAITVISLPVQAQDQGGRRQRPPRGERQPMGQRLTEEQSNAAWQVQARTMARGLEVGQENAKKMIGLYVEARTGYAKAMDDLRTKWREASRGDREGGEGEAPPDRRRGGQRGGGDEARAEMAKVAETHRKKLGEGLGAFLEGRELEYATEVLGSFNPGWDNMVHAITVLKMDKEKTGQSLKVIEAHIAETVVLRRSGDREGQREAQASARAKLSEKMKAILDDEQFARFQQAMGGRRGGGQRGGGERGGRGMAGRIEQWDTNGDGKLQKDEIPEQMLPMFDRLDANGDGELDEEELEAMTRGRGGQGGGRGGGGADGF